MGGLRWVDWSGWIGIGGLGWVYQSRWVEVGRLGWVDWRGWIAVGGWTWGGLGWVIIAGGAISSLSVDVHVCCDLFVHCS